MMQETINQTKAKMQKSLEALQTEFTKIRSGRAHPSLLDQISVDYYGNKSPLNQVASVHVEDARTLLVTPWEKTMVAVIEKAILTADLGLNPSTQGTAIRVPMPMLTEERRKDIIKVVKAEAEKTRVAIRNIRREALTEFKQLHKSKDITEDEERKGGHEVQKLTDNMVHKADEIMAEKEKDLSEI